MDLNFFLRIFFRSQCNVCKRSRDGAVSPIAACQSKFLERKCHSADSYIFRSFDL